MRAGRRIVHGGLSRHPTAGAVSYELSRRLEGVNLDLFDIFDTYHFGGWVNLDFQFGMLVLRFRAKISELFLV